MDFMNKLLVIFTLLLSGCSAMGSVAKSTFYTAKETWDIQPQAVRDAYPLWVQKKFYTSELLLSPIKDWRIKIVSFENISQDLIQGTVRLQYNLDEIEYSINTPLHLEKVEFSDNDNPSEFSFIFSMNSANATKFWEEYHDYMFKFDKPWFDYFLQPLFKNNPNITKKIKRIEYNFVDNFGFLTLTEFMKYFDFMDDDKWQKFCDNTSYIYNKTGACGVVVINDTNGY
jgi:hypothetical protein